MKQLSDLLREAKADAPPPRLDVDDMVAAGRRRVRRRNTEWAFMAVVAVVALVVGVPRLLSSRTDEPVLPVAPAPGPSAAASYHSFVYPFRGFSAGDYKVMDPDTVALGRTSTAIRRDGNLVGTLNLYPAGTRLADIYPDAATATTPINGRPAFLQPNGFGTDVLAWEYTAGALAVVEAPVGGGIDDLRRIATAFTLGGGQPARLGFRVSYVPEGYRLVSVTNTRQPDPVETLAKLVPDAAVAEMLADPERLLKPGVVQNVIGIRMAPAENVPSAGIQPKCAAEECSMLAGSNEKYGLEVTGRGAGAAEIQKVFESILHADPADPASWYPVEEAFPASVRVPLPK